MNKEKYQAFCEEFPFIERYCSSFVGPLSCLVKLPEPELLVRRAGFDHLLSRHDEDVASFVILNKAGKELCMLAPLVRPWWNPFRWFGSRFKSSAITVAEAITGSVRNDTPHYILKLFRSGRLLITVTVYRPRKSRTLLETVEEIRQSRLMKAREEVQKITQQET